MADAETLFAPEAVADIVATRGFPDYLRRSVAVWPGEAADDAVLANGLRDARRYISGMMVLYLAGTPGGLTVSRLAALLAFVGQAPARAPAAIALMRFLGLIEPVRTRRGDGRVRAYRRRSGWSPPSSSVSAASWAPPRPGTRCWRAHWPASATGPSRWTSSDGPSRSASRPWPAIPSAVTR